METDVVRLAMRFGPGTREEVESWCGGTLTDDDPPLLMISTPDGVMVAHDGHWVTRLDDGMFRPYDPKGV